MLGRDISNWKSFYVILQALATYNDALLFFYPTTFLCQKGMNDITNGFIISSISDNHYYVIVGVALMLCAEWRQRVYGFWLLVPCRWEWVSNLYHNDTNNIYIFIYIYIYPLTHTYIYISAYSSMYSIPIYVIVQIYSYFRNYLWNINWFVYVSQWKLFIGLYNRSVSPMTKLFKYIHIGFTCPWFTGVNEDLLCYQRSRKRQFLLHHAYTPCIRPAWMLEPPFTYMD